MTRAFAQLLLLCVLLTLNSVSVSAQDSGDQHLTFAGVEGSELRLYTYDFQSRVMDSRTLAQADSFDNITWSPEGIILSYIQTVEPHVGFSPRREELIYFPVPTEPDYADPYVMITTLSQGLETSYRSNFSEDGLLTLVMRPAEDRIYEDNNVHGVVLDVYQAYYMAGAGPLSNPQKVGEIVREYGCGHTASTPMEALLDTENEDSAALVAVTSHGIVFSPGCFGDGLMLNDLQANSYVPLRERISQPRISPDTEYVAGSTYQDNIDLTLEVVAVADGSLRQYPLDASRLTQFAWSSDGTSLFYAVQTPGGRIDVTDDELSALSAGSGFWDDLLTTYTARLFRLDLISGESDLLYTTDAYAIGRIEVFLDGSGLVFSQIANGGRPWVEHALQAGHTFSYQDDAADLVDLTLHYLPLDGGEARLLGSGIAQLSVYPAGSN